MTNSKLDELRAKYALPNLGQVAAERTKPSSPDETVADIARMQHDCWNISQLRSRMPRFKLDGVQLDLMRHSWTLANGPIPRRQKLRKLCRNPLCFNPKHMYLRGPNADSIWLSMASDALNMPDQSLNAKALHKASEGPTKRPEPKALGLARAQIKLLEQEIKDLEAALIESETARFSKE